MKIIIGARKSRLALWQASWVAGNLERNGVRTEIIPIITRGDRIQNVTISKIGSKGVFTEELENMLASGEIDIAVHSAKDLQSRLSDEFDIIAFGQREQVNDVIIARGELDSTGTVTLGTSSTRRQAQLRHFRPNVRVVGMRGNLQTRIEKMDAGECDALVLAAAGVVRMEYGHLIREELDVSMFTPAVGQGSIAVEVHASLPEEKQKMVRQCNNHSPTENCLLAERSFLSEMEGGCSIPIFGLANIQDEEIDIHGGIISLDGSQVIRDSLRGGSPKDVGIKLARRILERGGDLLLKQIKEQLEK